MNLNTSMKSLQRTKDEQLHLLVDAIVEYDIYSDGSRIQLHTSREQPTIESKLCTVWAR